MANHPFNREIPCCEEPEISEVHVAAPQPVPGADDPEHPIVGPEDGSPCCEHCAKHPGSQWTLKVSQPVSASHRNFICPTDEIQCDWPKCVDPKSGDSYFDVECLKRMNAVSGDAPQCNPVGGIERASKRDLEVITEPIDWEKVENSCCEWNAPKVEEIAKKAAAEIFAKVFRFDPLRSEQIEKIILRYLRPYFPPASQTPELLAELKLLTVKDGKPGVAFERYTKLWGLLPAIINALGATPASTARTDAIQWPQSVPPSEFSMEFVQYMANRMAFSFFRYGHIANAYPDKVNALESLELRLKSYQETRNTEFLVDAANFCMIEFMYPSIEGAEFIADRHDSPGRVCQAGYATVAKNSEIAAPGSVPQAPDNHSDLFFGNLQYSLQTLFAKAGNPFKDLAEWGAVWEALESARKHFGVPQAEPPKEYPTINSHWERLFTTKKVNMSCFKVYFCGAYLNAVSSQERATGLIRQITNAIKKHLRGQYYEGYKAGKEFVEAGAAQPGDDKPGGAE